MCDAYVGASSPIDSLAIFVWRAWTYDTAAATEKENVKQFLCYSNIILCWR